MTPFITKELQGIFIILYSNTYTGLNVTDSYANWKMCSYFQEIQETCKGEVMRETIIERWNKMLLFLLQLMATKFTSHTSLRQMPRSTPHVPIFYQ